MILYFVLSLYIFINYMEKLNKTLYQSEDQINGTNAHKAIDNKTYSSRKNIFTRYRYIFTKYGIEGKIDIFDIGKGELVERKK